MKNFLRFGILSLFLLLHFQKTYATHIVGGELEMRYVIGNTYIFNMVMYFDAANGNVQAIDPTATIYIFEKSNNRFIQALTLPRTTDVFVPYTNPACAIGNLSTRKIGYTLQTALDPNTYTSPQGYYVVWQRCCRNGVINNLINPGGAGQTFYTEFPPLIRNGARFINSTPQLFPPLSDYACVNQPFFFDFSGTDADGDRLVYSMSHPLNGSSSAMDPLPSSAVPAPYALVNFVAGINVNNMVPGNPALNISSSGLVTLKASRAGLHVFAVKCEEFRNNVKIGEVRRDFQLLVLDCRAANPPKIQTLNPTGGLITSRDTIVINASETNPCTTLEIRDTDLNTRIRVRINPINFTNTTGILGTVTTGTLNGSNDVLKIPLCFPMCPTVSPTTYTMDVIAEDNSCAVPLLDTARVNVRVINSPNQKPKVTTSLTTFAGGEYKAQVIAGQPLSFTIFGDDADRDFITLSATGQGFNLSSVGINFATVSGNPPLRQTLLWTPKCDLLTATEVQKDYLIKFQVIDRRRCGLPLLDTITARVTVKNPKFTNRKPSINTSVLRYDSIRKMYIDTVFIQRNISFDVVGDDIDRDSIRLSFVGLTANATTLGARFTSGIGLPKQTGKFSWTPTCDAVDTKTNPTGKAYDFLFTNTDLAACNASLFDTTRVRIFVKPIFNRKPAITTSLKFDAISKTYYDTVYVKSKLVFDVLGDDIDKDTVNLSYEGIGFPLNGLGTSLTNTKGLPILKGKFTWDVPCSAVEANNFAGKPYNFNFIVRDLPPCPNGMTDTVKVKIFVKAVNNLKPSITAGLPYDSNRKIYYDSVKVGGTFRFPVTGTDPEKDSVVLSMQGINIVSTAGLGMTFTVKNGKAPQTGIFNWKTFCSSLDDTLKAKDYNLRFIVRDFDQCGNSKYDTLQVRLRVLPNLSPNTAPITSTDIGTGKYNVTTKTYTDTVLLKTLYRFTVLADDNEKDSLLLRGNGIGFDFATMKMQFQSISGFPIIKSQLVWQPTCDMLPAGQESRVFLMRFISQDFRDCQRSKFDTINVRLVLRANPADNIAPTVTPTVLNLTSPKVYNRTITAGDTLNFKLLVDDLDKDSVSISATGLADGMAFTGIKAIAAYSRDFRWITDCSLFRGNITPKDYTITFTIQDFKSCGTAKNDKITVNLRLIPLPNQNPPRLYFTDSTTYIRTVANRQREFSKTVKPGESVALDFTAIDADKDIVTIEAVGEGFTLADFGMRFTNVRGIAPQTTKLEWAVDCAILKRKQNFRIRFITQDQVVCRVTKADTMYINFKIEDVAIGREFKTYNVFTPNGDGKNDSFVMDIPNDNCEDTFLKIVIYNRWGKLVYESNDKNFAWEATGFPAGLYYWYVEFKNKKHNGVVTLLKDE